MLFLLNDTVLRLDGVAMDARLGGQRMQNLEFPAILGMGQDLYAREPPAAADQSRARAASPR